MTKGRIHITLDEEIITAIDEARGSQDRSAYLNDLLYYGLLATDDVVELCHVSGELKN